MKRYIRLSTTPQKDVFNLGTTGTSYYDRVLNDDGLAYMQESKNLTGEIVWGTPREYFEKCADMFNTSVDSLIEQRSDGLEKEYAHDLASGEQYDLPYIFEEDQSQEGLHRMLAAAIAFGWNCKVPWLEVKPYNVD